MASATVRISLKTHERLKDLAMQEGSSMQDVLDKVIERYRRQLMFDQADAGYRALWADPEAAKAELEERALWDSVLMDGLDPNEVWLEDGTVVYRDATEKQPA